MELFYNPERMSETEIKETFVARNWIVDEITSIVAQQPDGAGVQHTIIIAPRGMGKTTLLLMLRFALLHNKTNKSWQPVLFPEESYQIYDLADFWLATLDHISSETSDDKLVKEIADLTLSSEPEEVALARIKDWKREHEKRLVLLVDGFDIILEQIRNERDHAALREVLMNDGTMMLVGTAPTFFKATRSYDKPLYNLFKTYNLEELNSEQIEDLLRRRAAVDNVEGFDELLKKNASRLRVLRYFTGGNPRLVLMLYRVLTQSRITDVKRDLEKLLDEVTPYYKAKIETLPPQQRKILDHIARVTARTGEGLTPTEIAAATRLAVNQVSSQLKRLSDVGYVRSANIRGRSSYYTLSEPLYAIWHQMRFGRDARQRMQWLIAFIKGWYDAEEATSECQRLQAIFHTHLSGGHVSDARDALEHRRYLVEVIANGTDRARTMESIILDYLDLNDLETSKELLEKISPSELTDSAQRRLRAQGLIVGQANPLTSKESNQNDLRVFVRLGLQALLEGQFEEANKRLRSAIELSPTNAGVYLLLAGASAVKGSANDVLAILQQAETKVQEGELLFSALRSIIENNVREAEASLSKLSSESASANWLVAGTLLKSLQRYEEAILCFRYSAELKPETVEPWLGLANSFNRLNRYSEALEALDRAVKLESSSFTVQRILAKTLMNLQRYSEAVTILDEALKIKKDDSETWMNHGISLFQLGEEKRALLSFERAYQLDPTSDDAFVCRISSLVALGHHDSAIKLSKTRLQKHPLATDALFFLGIALLQNGQYREALDAFRGSLQTPSEAHRSLLDDSEGIPFRMIVALDDGNIEQASEFLGQLELNSQHVERQKQWSETATALNLAALLGHWSDVRKLISSHNLEQKFFPLTRALDYLITGDESLVETLSPEIKGIVQQIANNMKAASRKMKPRRSRKAQPRRKTRS